MVDIDSNTWKRLATEIESAVNTARQDLESLTGELIEARPKSDEWSVKEVIGHLVDSASNNHQRFVRLQVSDGLNFPDYSRDNETWVSIQDYQNASWTDLLALWRYLNIHLAHVIRNVDGGCIDHVWVVDEDTTVSLSELMTDYLRHLQDHIEQINSLIHNSD